MAGDEARHGEPESEATPFELAVAWARTIGPGPVRRDALPAAVQGALDAAIAGGPGGSTVLAARTLVDGVETARLGPEGDLPADDELVVVSVVTSDVTTTAIHVVAHSVIVHVGAE